MKRTGFLGAAIFLSLDLWVSLGEAVGSHRFRVGGQRPAPFKSPSSNVQVPHVLILARQSGISRSAGYLQSLRKGAQVNGIYGDTPLASVEEGQIFLAGIEFGTEKFQAVVDTGNAFDGGPVQPRTIGLDQSVQMTK